MKAVPQHLRGMIVAEALQASRGKKGEGIRAVAEKYKVDPQTVRRLLKKYNETGAVAEKHRPGRPRALEAGGRQRARLLLLDPHVGGTHGVALALHSEGHTPGVVHRTTAARAAKQQAKAVGVPIRPVRTLPKAELPPPNKPKRLAFARSKKRERWLNAMFVDRSKFLFEYPGQAVARVQWVERGKQRVALRASHPLALNVYAGITKYGMTRVHAVAGTHKHRGVYTTKQGTPARNITTAEYEDVLKQTLLPEGNRLFGKAGITSWVLVQDNDPTHRQAGKVVKQYTTSYGGTIKVLSDWPPRSPDFNPIEEVWGMAKQNVRARGCKTFDDFKRAVIEELEAVGKKHGKALFDSMKKRMEACVAVGGGKTKY